VAQESAVRHLRLSLALLALLPLVFLATGPWHVAGLTWRYLNVAIAVGVVLAALVWQATSRGASPGAQLELDARLSRQTVLVAAIILFLALLRVVLGLYASLSVNAWDFSLCFDLPLARLASGVAPIVDHMNRHLLGVHAFWLVLAVTPLYALVPSPYWLLGLHAAAVAGGTVAAFAYARRRSGDDVVAAGIALAFVLNAATGRAVNYPFHPEVFFPLGLFLAAWALEADNAWAFAGAVGLLLAVKEDAIIPLTAVVVMTAWRYRRPGWAAATAVCAASVFLLDTRLAMPHFAGPGAAEAWYAPFWASFGATPGAALLGLATSPVEVVSRLARSGVPTLLASLLLIPLAGWEWFLLALPAMAVYASADNPQIASLGLYYAMPLVPLLILAMPDGVARVASAWQQDASPGAMRRRRRIVAGAALLVSAIAFSPYRVDKPCPSRNDVRPELATLDPGTPVLVQGALLPHAGYRQGTRVLTRDATGCDGVALLLDPAADPFPLRRGELQALAKRLSNDPRYDIHRSPNGLLLLTPTHRVE
jgi:uncharacterized membrane protein